MGWNDDQAWEADWWGPCLNTFAEEDKQIAYAHRMGLVNEPDPYTGGWPSYDLGGQKVIDIGGGPVSLLLKCRNRGPCVVVDPCDYPEWVDMRYAEAGIRLDREPGEQITEPSRTFDEAWIYNCLQHTMDPGEIVRQARRVASVLRIFEWIDAGTAIGHPHNLTVEQLEKWCGGRGTVERMNENGCVGQAWYGVFDSSCEHEFVTCGYAGDQGDGIDHPPTSWQQCTKCGARP